METVPAKFSVLAALGGRRSAIREVVAVAALFVIWTTLWAWFILDVAAPASGSVRLLSTQAAPAAEVALQCVDPSQRAP
ncbi:MAG TPA: hypothetical protein VFG53_12140 [Anaeromyxobacter sp.]|nr:hypothetical protein [Anaeromyxobacter sp.]